MRTEIEHTTRATRVKVGLTVKAVAEQLIPSVSKWRVYELLRKGRFPNAFKRQRDWFIPLDDVKAENKRRRNVNAKKQ